MKESLLAVVTIALSASAITSPVIAEENDGKGGMELQGSDLFHQMILQAMRV